PGDTRPDDYVTIPRFAFAEGTKLVASVRAPKDADDWKNSVAPARRANLAERVLGGLPPVRAVGATVAVGQGGAPIGLEFESEPGITLRATIEPGSGPEAPRALILN